MLYIVYGDHVCVCVCCHWVSNCIFVGDGTYNLFSMEKKSGHAEMI